ncbi:MAG: Trk system potassium transporter TrkA [Pseudomonadota bacterium]
MRIIICGAGRVGKGIAERLAAENHSITLVDSDERLVDQVSTDLEVRGVRGHAPYPDVLRAAGAEDCEMIIAVTHEDEINMVVCQVAHSLFSVPTKIARIRANEYLDGRWKNLFARSSIPIDMTISPEREVASAVIQRLKTPGAIMSASFAKGRIELLAIDIGKDNPLIDVPVDQVAGLFPDLSARIIGIGKNGRINAPRSNDKLSLGDRVYVAVLDIHASRLNAIFNREEAPVSHVTIVGAGRVGLHVAERLLQEKHYRVRLIEQDAQMADQASEILRNAIVIHGDGLNPEIIEEARSGKGDFLISITDDDRTNLLVCNLAKRVGVERTLALVNDPHLAPLKDDMKIDSIIDPRALTVSQVLLKLRRGRILALRTLGNGEAEVVEGITQDTSPLIGQPLEYDDLPDGITAAAILRGDDVIFPGPGVTVQSSDRLILLFERGMVKKVERYFRVSLEYFQ